MSWGDTLTIVCVLGFIGLLIWSKLQGQTMLDTVKEIKDIFVVIFGGK
jgi:hypothetical protein